MCYNKNGTYFHISEEMAKDEVKTIGKALNILEFLSNNPAGLALTKLSKELGMPNTTTIRLLQTLVGRGYVNQHSKRGKYFLSLKFLTIGGKALNSFDVGVKVIPFLKELAEKSKETVHFAVLEEGKVVYLKNIGSAESLQVYKYPGERDFVHTTAVGKILLAGLSNGEVDKIILKNGLPKCTPNTITSLEELKKHLEKVRKQGFAIDNEESEKGAKCIAGFVRNYVGKVIASISVSGPSVRISRDQVKKLSKLVEEICREASQHLGYTTHGGKKYYKNS